MISSLKQSIYTLVFLLKFVENVPDSALPTNIYYRALEDGDRSLPPTFSPVFAYPTGFLGFTPQQKSPVSTVQNNKRLCRTCSCGLMNTSRRIVGGQETEKYEYPWVAMLIAYNKAYCGATLINRNYVITAAHCVLSQRISALTVRLLSHRRTPIDRTAIDLKISKLIPHPGFNYNNYADDIALVKLWPPAPLSNILLPVCLPDPRKPFNPKMGVVVGWGNTVENGRVSNSLREVAVPILPEKECRSKSSLITDNMLCAGEEMGGKDACQGDSGGPLLFLDGVEFAIGGIVSWGEGCARPNKPGVYTKVSKYYNWIMKNTNDSCYCSRLSELQ